MPRKISLKDKRFYDIYEKLKPYTYTQNRDSGIKSFTNDELTEIALTDLKNEDFKVEKYNNGTYNVNKYIVKKDVLDQNLEMYFKSPISVDYELNRTYALYNTDFVDGSGFELNTYDDKLNAFVGSFGGIGGLTALYPKLEERKIIEAIIEKDTITIKENVIYYQNISDPFDDKQIIEIYKDYKMQEKIDTKVYDSDTIRNNTISVNDYLDESSTIVTIFKKDDKTSKYYFEKSIIEGYKEPKDEVLVCDIQKEEYNFLRYIFYFENNSVNEIKSIFKADYNYYFSEDELLEKPCLTSDGKVYYNCDLMKIECPITSMNCTIGGDKNIIEVTKSATSFEEANEVGLGEYYNKPIEYIMDIASQKQWQCN